jgi:hypothetical protein
VAEQEFELSEYRDRNALASFLIALCTPAIDGTAQPPAAGVRYAEVAARIGPGAAIPPTSPVEILVELSIRGEPYRFAAARVTGRTFRGLLAGPKGKVWAERFELDSFPGIQATAARLLQVPEREIIVVGEDPSP